MTRGLLYPAGEPFAVHRIPVTKPHELWVAEAGLPEGVPVIALHGGPGAGAKPEQRTSFDPRRFRIIQFDQRGCGRSTPSAELEGNTTADLVEDIERIRGTLGIDRWMVAGGSWGSMLALCYAIAHPERCLSLMLHGIFLGSREEIALWFHGIGAIFPDAFEAFAGHVDAEERHDLLAAYYRRLTDPEPRTHLAAADAMRTFSARTQTFLPSPAHIHKLTEPKAALELSRLFAHYCVNGFFVPEEHVLSNIDAIRHIPAEIVQGRYDVVTPMRSAWRLHQAWPEARFTIVPEANHVATRAAPALAIELRNAAERLADGNRLSIVEYLAPRAHRAPSVSDDGTVLAWLSNETGTDQIWTRSLEDGSAEPALRLQLDEPVGNIAFRPGSRDIVLTTDTGGDEHHQLHLLRADANQPEALTAAPGQVHQWGAFDADGRRIAYSCNPRDATAMEVHVRDLETGTDRVIRDGPGWRTARAFTPDGSAVLVEENIEGMYDAALVLVPVDGGKPKVVMPADKRAHVNAARWAEGGKRLLVATDRGASFHGLAAIDPESGNFAWLAQPDGDVEHLAVDKSSGRIAYAWNSNGYSRIVICDASCEVLGTFDPPYPARVTSLMFAPDGAHLILALGSFRRPSVIARMRTSDGATEMVCQGPCELDEDATVEPEARTVQSFDGRDVPVFVFEPKGPPPPGGRPAFVVVHGGPESQYAAHWRSDVQYFVSRGWMVVAPNVRGSTGYGREWQAADDLDRRMDSVRDLKAVRDWLAARADVNAEKLAVYGQSYGGFMVLAAITEYPDDWCVAAEFYGIADFNTMMDTTGPWRRKLRAVEYGNPDTEAGRALLWRLSPMRKIGRVRTPLFIAHGGDDPRVPPAESELVYAALRGRGHDCVLMRIDHEGHGFVRPENRRRIYEAMVRFIEDRTRARGAQDGPSQAPRAR